MKEFTGSYICFGLVFEKTSLDLIKKAFTNLIMEYPSKEYLITIYCNDTDDSSEYSENSITENYVEELITKDYFALRFDTIFLNKETQVLISNSFLEKYYAIQIDFHEELLLNCFNNDYLECLKYIDYIAMKLFAMTDFEYAFCDNNATFGHLPIEIVSGENKEYSLIYILKDSKGLEVIRQNRELDGYSTRKQELVGNFLLN